MSKMIQLRHVLDTLHRRLKARAALSGLPLSDYLIREVRKIAEYPSPEENVRASAAARALSRQSLAHRHRPLGTCRVHRSSSGCSSCSSFSKNRERRESGGASTAPDERLHAPPSGRRSNLSLTAPHSTQSNHPDPCQRSTRRPSALLIERAPTTTCSRGSGNYENPSPRTMQPTSPSPKHWMRRF